MATTVASSPVEMPVSAAPSPAVLDRWSPGGYPLQLVDAGNQCDEESVAVQGSHPPDRPATSHDGGKSGSDASSSDGSAGGSGDPKGISPLIVFDWDDTMLTSSWIQSRELLQAGSFDDLPLDAQRDLAHLEQR